MFFKRSLSKTLELDIKYTSDIHFHFFITATSCAKIKTFCALLIFAVLNKCIRPPSSARFVTVDLTLTKLYKENLIFNVVKYH